VAGVGADAPLWVAASDALGAARQRQLRTLFDLAFLGDFEETDREHRPGDAW
jgi:hypothetical protein